MIVSQYYVQISCFSYIDAIQTHICTLIYIYIYILRQDLHYDADVPLRCAHEADSPTMPIPQNRPNFVVCSSQGEPEQAKGLRTITPCWSRSN